MFQNMRKYEIPKLLFFSLMNAINPETFSWAKKFEFLKSVGLNNKFRN